MSIMADQQVQMTTTPVTAQALYDAIREAWSSIATGPFVPVAALVLVAQSAFETGSWQSVYNWNLGGQKYVPGTGEDYFTSPTTEGPNGAPTTARFASFPTLAAGIQNWLGLIYDHYQSAWQQALAGDPGDFVAALKSGGYFTGDESTYAARVTSLYNKFRGTVDTSESQTWQAPAPASPLPAAVLAAGTVAAGVALWQGVTWLAERARPRRRYARA